MDGYSDAMVRTTSFVAFVIIVFQLLNAKGGYWHVLLGYLGALDTLVLFASVAYRGIAQWGQPHGALYPVHLALGTLFFISYGFAVYYGIRSRGDLFAVRNHRIFAWAAALFVCSSLAAGITSAVSK